MQVFLTPKHVIHTSHRVRQSFNRQSKWELTKDDLKGIGVVLLSTALTSHQVSFPNCMTFYIISDYWAIASCRRLSLFKTRYLLMTVFKSVYIFTP